MDFETSFIRGGGCTTYNNILGFYDTNCLQKLFLAKEPTRKVSRFT